MIAAFYSTAEYVLLVTHILPQIVFDLLNFFFLLHSAGGILEILLAR